MSPEPSPICDCDESGDSEGAVVVIDPVQGDHFMPAPHPLDNIKRFQFCSDDGLSGWEAARRLMISPGTGVRLAKRVRSGARSRPRSVDARWGGASSARSGPVCLTWWRRIPTTEAVGISFVEDYAEKLRFNVPRKGGSRMDFQAAARSGTWTVVYAPYDNISCVAAVGTGWIGQTHLLAVARLVGLTD